MSKGFWVLVFSLLTSSLTAVAGMLPELGLIYTAETTMTLNLTESDNRLDTTYIRYLLGEPHPGLQIMSYLHSGGYPLDQIWVGYTRNNLELEWGDTSWEAVGGSFFNFQQRQRGGVIRYSLLDDHLKVQALKAKINGIHHTEVIEGMDSIGPYYLSYGSVTPGSEQILKEGLILIEDDYSLEYATGALTFAQPLYKDEEAEVSYTYQPGGGTYDRSMLGSMVSAEWDNFTGNLSHIQVKDDPKDGLPLLVKPKTLEASHLNMQWKISDLVTLDNELALSSVDSDTNHTDWAYEGSVKVGTALNYLQLEHLRQGADFYQSLDSIEPNPKSLYSVSGRLQLTPSLYLFSHKQHEHNNPEKDPNLITAYENNQLSKLCWDTTATSWLQLTHAYQDTGDDLLYLPIGRARSTTSLAYYSRGPWTWHLGLDSGSLIYKNPSSTFLNYDFAGVTTGHDWKSDKWRLQVEADCEYIEPHSNPQASRTDFEVEYSASRDISRGKIAYSGRAEKDESLWRQIQRLSVSKTLANKLQTRLSYNWITESSSGFDKEIETNASVRLIYYGSSTIDTALIVSETSWRTWLAYKNKSDAVQVSYADTRSQEEAKLNIKFSPTDKLHFENQLKSTRNKLKGNPITSLILKATYKFSRNVKATLHAETPLGNQTTDCQKTLRLEITFSL